MTTQTTLMTCHKGVDLHAATAGRVMCDRLDAGRRLVSLHRCEYTTFWTEDRRDAIVSRLLETGRTFNPNKHNFGLFVLENQPQPWFERDAECRGAPLPDGWPGRPERTDCGIADAGLLDRLLGGPPGADCTSVDVCTFPLGETGPLLAGVLWRLVLRTTPDQALAVAENLSVTRSRTAGLLVNPHMQGWLLSRQPAASPSQASTGAGSGRLS